MNILSTKQYFEFKQLVAAILLVMSLTSWATERFYLHQGWSFKQERGINWMPAIVPGTVHTDLMNNKQIEDPYFRLNERGVQWVDKEDWIYRAKFDVPKEQFECRNAVLHFEGLDTYADVKLNGKSILSADNMFRQWRVDVRELLRERDNELEILFHSPLKVATPMWDALPYKYHSNNDQSENGGMFDKKVGVFVRKAGYHFGWDWGPRLVTSGIWRPLYLETWNNARINNIRFMQPSVTEKLAKVEVEVEIEADEEKRKLLVEVVDTKSGQVMAQAQSESVAGLSKRKLAFEVKNPRRWWTNGLGEAHLYHYRTRLSVDGREVDSITERIGLRSLRLVTKPDKWGTSLYFELNGVPLFVKGANYIPCDVFLPRITDEVYRQTILDAVRANMNMLRVWGGGIYEDNRFYDLCDEYGILVWQDFMFACSMYPAEGKLLENIRQEAIDNVKRLRNHTCIALWCGNNECLDAWFNWGWKKTIDQQNPKWSEIIWKQYCDQYYTVLPEVVKEFNPETSYRPTAPYNNTEGQYDERTGDAHYWKVWHGKEPISEYNRFKSRFFSEYGFQSFPEFESIKRFAPQPEDWNITSDVLFSHQRGGTYANQVIDEYLRQEYRDPKDFESFVYTGLVLQGDAIKTAMEAHRRDKGQCMGSLFWQHNDCWPVASWSSRDYYGRWKAQHYFARHAFADVLVSPIQEEGMFRFYVISDRLNPFRGTLHIRAMEWDGKIVFEEKIGVLIKANASQVQYACPVERLLNKRKRNQIVITVTLTDDKGQCYANTYSPCRPKEIDYPLPTIKREVAVTDGGVIVRLTADTFARATYILLPGHGYFAEDNFFDLLPGETREVLIRTSLSKAEVEQGLTIRTLADTWMR